SNAASSSGSVAISSTEAVPASPAALWSLRGCTSRSCPPPAQAGRAEGDESLVGVRLHPDPPDRPDRDREQEDPGERAAARVHHLVGAGDQQDDQPEGPVEDRAAAIGESREGELVLTAERVEQPGDAGEEAHR